MNKLALLFSFVTLLVLAGCTKPLELPPHDEGFHFKHYERVKVNANHPPWVGSYINLKEGDQFPEPLFTPTTKAEEGHDMPMSLKELGDMVGTDMAKRLEENTIEIYATSDVYARSKGIIIADTKLEFGLVNGELTVIDELLTPDSSRFWDAEGYAPGKSQPNYDKQFVRDALTSMGWDREPPAPELTQTVVDMTVERYREAYQRLTGQRVP